MQRITVSIFKTATAKRITFIRCKIKNAMNIEFINKFTGEASVIEHLVGETKYFKGKEINPETLDTVGFYYVGVYHFSSGKFVCEIVYRQKGLNFESVAYSSTTITRDQYADIYNERIIKNVPDLVPISRNEFEFQVKNLIQKIFMKTNYLSENLRF